MKQKGVLKITGQLKLCGADWTLEEYRALFGKLNDMASEGKVSRLMRFYGQVNGKTVLRFFGVEGEVDEIPDGLIILEPGKNTLTVSQRANGKIVEIWQKPMVWRWLDEAKGKGVGEFSVAIPEGWTGQSQPVDFLLTANSYFQKGKYAPDDVKLEEYNPDWPAMYEKMASKLRRELPPEIIVTIQHFGSTAIPGIPAKPVIDVMLEVPSLATARQKLIMYFNKPEIEYWMQEEDMTFIVREGFSGVRTHHIHAAQSGSPYLKQVAFRDYLRAHPEDAQCYASLKQNLAARYKTDREAYTNAKAEFIKGIMAKALR